MFTVVYTYEGVEHRQEFAHASDARAQVAEWQLTDWKLYDPQGNFMEGYARIYA
jgi:hypothetical protein